MIKNFETYINEDYFSKLANRKDNGKIRKEDEITEDFVRSFVCDNAVGFVRSITIRKENGKQIVDIEGSFFLRDDIEQIPFQFGKVSAHFVCSYCPNLTSLEGCPREVGGYFDCHGCKNLTSLEGCPEKVGRDFKCWDCGKKFTEDEVKSLCDVKIKIFL